MIRLFRQYVSPWKIIFVMGEGFLIFLAVLLASFYFLGRGIGLANLLEMIWPKIFVIVMVTQLSLYFNDLYEFKVTDSGVDLVSRLIQSIGITSIILAVIYFLWPWMIIGRWIFFASLIFLLLFLVSWRLLYALSIRKKLFAEKSVVLGTGELAKNILDEISSRKDLSYDIGFVIAPENSHNSNDNYKGARVRYGFENIRDWLEAENIKNVIVAFDEKRGVLPFRELLDCKCDGIAPALRLLRFHSSSEEDHL